jgi:hypothetical protein
LGGTCTDNNGSLGGDLILEEEEEEEEEDTAGTGFRNSCASRLLDAVVLVVFVTLAVSVGS